MITPFLIAPENSGETGLNVEPQPSHVLSSFASGATLTDGTTVMIRRIQADDQPQMVEFHKGLSERSVYLRYFYYFGLDRRTEQQRLRRTCQFSCDSEMPFVVEPRIGSHRPIIGIGRLSRSGSEPEAELSLVVTDSYQGRGVGSVLVSQLVDFARKLRLRSLSAWVLIENFPMRKIFEKAGSNSSRAEQTA